MVEVYPEEKNDVSVLVLGNATVDEVYAVNALPRTGESLSGQLCADDVGGKGANVATLLARCGLRTRLTTAVGDDERGACIRSQLALEPLELDIEVLPSTPSDVSLVFCDVQGNNTIVTTQQAAHQLQASRVMSALDQAQPGDKLVLQGNLTEELTRFAISQARCADLQIVFNPSPLVPWANQVLTDVDMLFVNAEEAQDLTGSRGVAAVNALLEQGPAQVVLTLGEQGALLGSRAFGMVDSAKDSMVSIPAVRCQVVDTTGAGDTFLAVALASACLRGTCLDSVGLRQAASAAARTVSRHGTRSAFPNAGELVEILYR